MAEAIQGPSPGAAQPRRAVGAADIRAGCGARRCQHQPGQQAARARRPAVPAKLPAPTASQHRCDARLAPRAAVCALQQRAPGLPRHVRGAVLMTQSPGKGGAIGPAPPPLAPTSPPPLLSPRLGPHPFLGPPRQPSPPRCPQLRETRRRGRGTPQRCLLGWRSWEVDTLFLPA